MAEYMSRDRTTFPPISRRLRPIFLHVQCMKFLFYVIGQWLKIFHMRFFYVRRTNLYVVFWMAVRYQHWSLCDMYLSGYTSLGFAFKGHTSMYTV
jgi:hypothetical protein